MGTNKSLLCIPSGFPRTAEFFDPVHATSEAPSESTGVPSSATGRKRHMYDPGRDLCGTDVHCWSVNSEKVNLS